MEELKQILLGQISIAQMVGFCFWIIMGFIIHMFWDFSQRDVKSESTPSDMNLKFWWLDNWKRLVLNLLLTIVIMRFHEQLFGDSMNAFISLIIGVNFDQIVSGLKKKITSLGTDRVKFMQNE